MEIKIVQTGLMGVETPIPPVRLIPPPPKGRPRSGLGGSNAFFVDKTDLAPLCPGDALKWGALTNLFFFLIFMVPM
jgi:hypothetical protein